MISVGFRCQVYVLPHPPEQCFPSLRTPPWSLGTRSRFRVWEGGGRRTSSHSMQELYR